MSQADLPSMLAGAVDGEDVVAHVDLGGEDALAVTPTRTLVYRADGLLSDESVTEYAHDVERIDVSEGRRKAKIQLEYGLDGTETITVPSKRVDDALHPILAGVLSAAGLTDPGESVLRTFRFSELTLIVTSDRLVKHVGSAVWDEEYEEFHYDDVTGLDFEEGTVATSVVLTHAGRQERFKAPNESKRAVREALTDAICEYHEVGSPAELRAKREADAEDDHDADRGGASTTDFGDGPDPLSASPAAEDEGSEPEASAETAESPEPTESPNPATPEGATASESPTTGATPETDPLVSDPVETRASDTEPAESGAADAPAADSEGGDGFGGSGFEPAGVEEEPLADEVAALRETVEAQSEQLDRQAELIEQLIEELRRGR
ncbi:DUF7115 domain-containing protein [Haloparvum sedimenti]|uniref:DUF7115 domain-containing protein n=1 Tax=Haloparvum sedimenti TaxID=1678448 RepID=UPI00071E81BB|nr:hypothetical protein [Haloparvum sedimenti]